jgi:hypothetical protein
MAATAGSGPSILALLASATTTPPTIRNTASAAKPTSDLRRPGGPGSTTGRAARTRTSSTAGAITRGTRAQPFSPASQSAHSTVSPKTAI